RAGFGPVSFATSAGTASDFSSSAIFRSTSRAASRSVAVSWPAAVQEARRKATAAPLRTREAIIVTSARDDEAAIGAETRGRAAGRGCRGRPARAYSARSPHFTGGFSMRSRPSLVLAMVLSALAPAPFARAADDRPSFTVGTATARRGQKATGAIEVPAGV